MYNYKIPEVRKYKRVEKPYITWLQTKPNKNKICKDWIMVAVINLSAGGIFFYTNKNLEVGTILDLKIGLSSSRHPIICDGRVIRKMHRNTSIMGFTIEFTEIDEHIIEMINSTVDEYVKYNNEYAL